MKRAQPVTVTFTDDDVRLVRTQAIAVLESVRKMCSLYEQLRAPAPPAALAAIGRLERRYREIIESIDAGR